MKNNLTLAKLYNTNFPDFYYGFLSKKEHSDSELELALSLGLYFIQLEDPNIKLLGYRLFLLYSAATHDYKPLYELTVNNGLIPIAQYIYENLDYQSMYGNLYTELNTAMNQKFKYLNTYRTMGQFELIEKAEESIDESQIIIAPTSYGKTELILLFVEKYSDKNVCILTPTKSLLAQTKKRIIDHFGSRKIVTFPEMYNPSEKNIIAVLTQERLLRLLQNNPSLKFDLLVVDEAHNMLSETSYYQNDRSLLLSSVVVFCYRRNEDLVIKYLTPFLASADSIQMEDIPMITDVNRVEEIVKSEMYFAYDLNQGTKMIFDQFSPCKDKFIRLDEKVSGNDVDVVRDNIGNKNIVFLNKPKDIETFSSEFVQMVNKTGFSSNTTAKIKKAARDLREYVHEDYLLAKFIEYGIIYHHGSVPDAVRMYLEDLYATVPDIKILVANSTLLEGVNIPATKLFILNPKRGRSNLSVAGFKNLVGRICRFSEIFNAEKGSLDYLLPEIYVVKGKYAPSNMNLMSFVSERAYIDKIVKDDVENPLMKKTTASVEEQQEAKNALENLSPNDTDIDKIVRKAKTKVGQLCFENKINIFNIFDVETELQNYIDAMGAYSCSTISEVFNLMNALFFSRMSENLNDDNLRRLKNEEAQDFYAMLINWRIEGQTYKQMVNNFVGYWGKLNKEQAENVYVGRWGTKTRGGHRELWTDISGLNREEKANLAIVRLKEEFDFIDNNLIKYIEVLNSLSLIDEDIYLSIKYGTSDKQKIALLNTGFSPQLANLISEKYQGYFYRSSEDGHVILDGVLPVIMEVNNDNGILITEVKMNLKTNY